MTLFSQYILSLIVPFMVTGLVASESSEPVAPAHRSSLTEYVDRLIRQLGSSKFDEREAAAKALEAVGEEALEPLRKAANRSEDAEVRRRASELATLIQRQTFQCLQGPKATPCTSMAFSRDARRVACYSGWTPALEQSDREPDGCLRVWELH